LREIKQEDQKQSRFMWRQRHPDRPSTR
jgi:hypothetical protein